MQPNNRTIVRAWNADGYHKDILVIDATQPRMYVEGVKEPSVAMMAPPIGQSMVIYPKDFPEMVAFQVIVADYRDH